MAKIANPFGDGHASKRIVRVLRNLAVAGGSGIGADLAREAQATDAVRADRIAALTVQPRTDD
jgi:hypothetical protein